MCTFSVCRDTKGISLQRIYTLDHHYDGKRIYCSFIRLANSPLSGLGWGLVFCFFTPSTVVRITPLHSPPISSTNGASLGTSLHVGPTGVIERFLAQQTRTDVYVSFYLAALSALFEIGGGGTAAVEAVVLRGCRYCGGGGGRDGDCVV